MSESLPPPPDDLDREPERTHKHGYAWDINDWWCYTCDTVTDFCAELNDYPEPKE